MSTDVVEYRIKNRRASRVVDPSREFLTARREFATCIIRTLAALRAPIASQRACSAGLVANKTHLADHHRLQGHPDTDPGRVPGTVFVESRWRSPRTISNNSPEGTRPGGPEAAPARRAGRRRGRTHGVDGSI